MKLFKLVIVTPILVVFLMSYFSSCKKEKYLTEGGSLSFSVDTLSFDTVFTSIGSFTNYFKVYNNENKRIRISNISFSSSDTSIFRMNVDGISGRSFTDIEIAPYDSIYVFVAVTINPTSGTLPFLVEEKINVTLNNKVFSLPLEAYGQDAHYIVDSILKSDTWINDKPYVIIHSALLDSAQVLTIQKGCRIYMHQDSKFYVKGSLRAFGTKEDSIVFQGDRLDRAYFGNRDFPGEWGGFVFTQSSYLNNFNYCIIKNAGNNTGVGAVSAMHISKPWNLMVAPMVELNNCRIFNSAGFGVVSFASQLRMANTLIHSCNLQCLAMVEGGEYDFSYCTFANYGGLGINHAQEPVVATLNFREAQPGVFAGSDLKAEFVNCIIDGSLEDEAVFNKIDTWAYNCSFTNCLMKRSTALQSYVVNNNGLLNVDPQFKNKGKWDFKLESTSPAKGAAIPLSKYIIDIDNVTRSLTSPSLGCHE